MSVIKSIGELKLVGFRVLCPGNQYVVEIPKASLQLSARLAEIKNVVNPGVQYGAFVVENESENEDGYWVCVEVKEYTDIPEDMVSLTIPSQMYAVARYEGPNHKIRDSYTELHNWIEANEFKRLTDKWHLEIFHSWKDPESIMVELLDTVSAEPLRSNS
jgi:predicted transcriptional regulator YdeE